MAGPGGTAGKARAAFLLVVALLAAALIAGGAYLALRGAEEPLSDPTRLIPADAVLVVEAAPLRRLDRRLDALGQAVTPDWAERRRKGWDAVDRAFGVADIDAVERAWGVDIDRPVAAAVFAWTGEAPAVLLLPVKAPKTFLRRQGRAAGLATGAKPDGRIWAGETSAWAIVGGYAVLGGRPDDVRRVVDVEEGRAPAIAGDPAFASPPAGDARIVIRGAPLSQAARAAFESYGPLLGLVAGDATVAVHALLEELVEALEHVETISVAVDLDSEAPRLRVRAAFDPAWRYLAALEPPASAFPLLERLPAGAVTWAAAYDASALADAAETVTRRLLEAAGEDVHATLALVRAAPGAKGTEIAQTLTFPKIGFLPGLDEYWVSAERVRDTAAYAATWAPAIEVSMRLGARLARGRATASRLPPVEIGGVRSPGLRVETVHPPAMKRGDINGLPGNIPKELLQERREVQIFRMLPAGDLVFTAGGAAPAAIEEVLRDVAGGPARPAAAAPGLRAVRERLPREGHVLVVVDPSEAIGADTPTALGAVVRRSAPGVVEAEAVWPVAHVRAFVGEVGSGHFRWGGLGRAAGGESGLD